MGWNRLKQILIAVLLAANLFLCVSLISIWNESTNIPSEAMENVTQLLANDHIYVADGAVSRTITHIPILYGNLYDDAYGQIASLLSESEMERSFSTPNGVLITLENGDRWTFSDSMNVQFTASEASPIATEEDLSEKLTAISGKEGKNICRVVQTFLNRVNTVPSKQSVIAELDFDLHILGYDSETGIVYCTAFQHVQTRQIHNFSAVFAVMDGKVIGMRGNWCFANPSQTLTSQLLDQVNILYIVKNKILEDRPEATALTIRSLTLCYTMYYHAASGGFYLIPAWRAELSDGYIYTINAINGSLYT